MTEGVSMKQLKVYEIRLKCFLMQDIMQEQSFSAISEFIDTYLSKKKEFMELHEEKCFKMYCFDQPYPVEKNGIYKKDNIYTVRIRTVNPQLLQYFLDNLANHYTNRIKGLTLDVRIVPKKMITEIYSITPAVIKCEENKEKKPGGYWKHCISFEQYEARIKTNLIKKYNFLMETKINEDFALYRQIELTNQKPIAVPYKNIKLLGDKICIQAAENDQAQELLYLAIGVGIGELNARGFGFINYKYL